MHVDLCSDVAIGERKDNSKRRTPVDGRSEMLLLEE